MATPRTEGQRAAWDEEGEDSNPHQPGTQAHREWLQGYRAMARACGDYEAPSMTELFESR